MTKSNESDIKNEIDEISKTIKKILKKIDSEREKLMPSGVNEAAPVNEEPPDGYDSKEADNVLKTDKARSESDSKKTPEVKKSE
jgi:hypothetical protein